MSKKSVKEEALKNLRGLADMWTLEFPALGKVSSIDIGLSGNKLNVWFDNKYWDMKMQVPRLFNNKKIKIFVKYCRLVIYFNGRQNMSYKAMWEYLKDK